MKKTKSNTDDLSERNESMAEKADAVDSTPNVGDRLRIQVNNVGGIDECEVSFEPGITVLTGRNATNRTSLLRAIAGVFGGTQATLKSDAETGSIELETDGSTYYRQYRRHGSSVGADGTPFSDRTELIGSFACLLGSNPARQAVERGEDLRKILMGPVDTDDVERKIGEVEREITRLEERIERIESEKERLPKLESDRKEHREELAELEAEIESVESEIEAADAGESEAREAEQLLDELEGERSERRATKRKLERQREKLDRLQDRRDELESELSELSVPDDRLSEVESEVERLKRRKRGLQNDVASLTEVIQFNDDLVSGDGRDLGEFEGDDDLTASLDPHSETVECWTCGSEVELGEIRDRLDGLRKIRSEKREERNEVEERLSELQSERRELEREVDEKDGIERELEDVERELDHRERKAEELEATLEDLDQSIADLENEVAETEDLRDSDLADAYQRRSEFEYQRGQVRQRIDDVEERIDEIENEVGKLDGLRTDLSDQKSRRDELRTYIEDLERETVERFNGHMEEVLSILGYENIARIWIERSGTAETSDKAAERFELHVVRESADGAGYEDVVANLSESERQIIGLVVGLVGYLVHEVYEEVPIVLLDSMEAIDANRISSLVEYFADFAPYLIVALLPEDEQAIPADYDRIDASVI